MYAYWCVTSKIFWFWFWCKWTLSVLLQNSVPHASRDGSLIKSQLPDIKIIVKESTDTLSMEIKALRMENAKLCADNAKLREDVDKLTNRVDKAETENDAFEQYTRRNNVRISGVPELEGEYTVEAVIKIANELQTHIGPSDIDRSDRVGKPKASDPSPGVTL